MTEEIPDPAQVGREQFDPQPLLSVVLPIELTNDNEGRSGTYHKSARLRQEYEATLRFTVGTREPFAEPVRCEVTRILGRGQRLWDYSSVLRGNWKEIEDALVALNWFTDDGPKYITHVAGFQDATRRKDGPAIRLEIFKS